MLCFSMLSLNCALCFEESSKREVRLLRCNIWTISVFAAFLVFLFRNDLGLSMNRSRTGMPGCLGVVSSLAILKSTLNRDGLARRTAASCATGATLLTASMSTLHHIQPWSLVINGLVSIHPACGVQSNSASLQNPWSILLLVSSPFMLIWERVYILVPGGWRAETISVSELSC